MIHRIACDFQGGGPSGITGNDDCGQMSVWFVLSTLGFYPVLPSSGSYVLGAPQVRAARLQLAGGRRLRIDATGFGPGRLHARRAWLDGRPVNALDLRHTGLLAGRNLRFEMQPLPR